MYNIQQLIGLYKKDMNIKTAEEIFLGRSHLIANVWDNIDPSLAIVVHYSQQGK
jgi:hypothetical protein